MIVRSQLSLSLVVAGICAWALAPSGPTVGNVVLFGFIAAALPRAAVRLSAYSGTRLVLKLVDNMAIVGGLIVMAIAIPGIFVAVQDGTAATLGASQLASIVKPLGLFVTLISAGAALLIIITVARWLAGAASHGRISYLAYKEATFFAAAAFIAGIIGFDIWTATTSLAAVGGYLLPMLFRSELATPKPGAIWLLLPDREDTVHSLRHLIRDFAREYSEDRPVTLVAPPATARYLGGDHLDLGFKLKKTACLFPTMVAGLRQWRSFTPPDEASMALPRRELYTPVDVMPRVIEDLVGPDDYVALLSWRNAGRSRAFIDPIVDALPAQRSLHVRIDDAAKELDVKRIRGHIEFTQPAGSLSADSMSATFSAAFPAAVESRPDDPEEKPAEPAEARPDLAKFARSLGSWHALALPLALVLFALDASSFDGTEMTLYRALLQIGAASLVFAVLISWLFVTLPDTAEPRKSTWLFRDARFLGITMPAYLLFLGVATLCLLLPIGYTFFEPLFNVLGLTTDQGPLQFSTAAATDVIEPAGGSFIDIEPYALVGLLVLWAVFPFRRVGEYATADTPTDPPVMLADMSAPAVGFWRVFLYVACGVGVAQILSGIFYLIDNFLLSLDVTFYREVISQAIVGVELFIVLYFGMRLMLLAVRHRWAPYGADANRFTLACLAGVMIALPVGALLQVGLTRSAAAAWAPLDAGMLYEPSIGVWFSVIGPIVGGTLFLQKRGLADIRNLWPIFMPIGIVAFLDGFITQDILDLFITDDILKELVWAVRSIAMAYFIFLIVVPRAMLRNAVNETVPATAAAVPRAGYRTLLATMLPVFILLFWPYEGPLHGGYWYVTELLNLAPGYLLLTAFMCAALTVRLQRNLPRPVAADGAGDPADADEAPPAQSTAEETASQESTETYAEAPPEAMTQTTSESWSDDTREFYAETTEQTISAGSSRSYSKTTKQSYSETSVDTGSEKFHSDMLEEPLLLMIGHEGAALSAEFSPDGRYIVSSGSDGTVRLWDAGSGQPLAVSPPQEGSIYSVAFSPDGRQIVTAGSDGVPKIRDERLRETIASLEGHGGETGCVVYSPDGRRIASASRDRTVRIWDANDRKTMVVLHGAEGSLWSVAFSPDGRFVVAGSSDRLVRVWELPRGDLRAELAGHKGKVWCVAWPPQGERIVTGSEDRTTKVWDGFSGKELLTLRDHRDMIRDVAFSPDGSLIVSASEDGTALLRNAATGQVLDKIYWSGRALTSARFSPDGNRIVTASHDGTVQVWQADSQQRGPTAA